ncbi:MAG TPA: NAD(P)-dependent oxidoreductase [Bryobacteraceae bacterium]|jgi:nucleoside-diphosphate-sugar epimerase|nr:NAD(P)-dependent oxidoreductase [Bryobacteraceae bacterium]
MKVLVTGASGFIGSHVLPVLLRGGHEVHAICRATAPALQGVQTHTADLLTADLPALLESIQPTHLLHLAWDVPPGKFWTAEENIAWLDASIRLLQAFAGVGGRRSVGAGTCAEYEWSRSGLFRESDCGTPATLYGACKSSLGTIAARLGEQDGLEVATGRVFFPYGPREPRERLVPSVIRSLLRGEPAGCTDGRQSRDYIYAEDVAAAFVTLLESDCVGAVNIGSGAGIAVREIVTAIGEITGRPELLRLGALPSKTDEPAEIVADVSRLRALGWQPRHSLREGLERSVEWWRARL